MAVNVIFWTTVPFHRIERQSAALISWVTTPASHLRRGDQVPARPNLATGRGASVGASTDREPVRDASRMRRGFLRAHGASTRPSLRAGPCQARPSGVRCGPSVRADNRHSSGLNRRTAVGRAPTQANRRIGPGPYGLGTCVWSRSPLRSCTEFRACFH